MFLISENFRAFLSEKRQKRDHLTAIRSFSFLKCEPVDNQLSVGRVHFGDYLSESEFFWTLGDKEVKPPSDIDIIQGSLLVTSENNNPGPKLIRNHI